MNNDHHLVIGGNGFLGRVLVHKLLEKNIPVKVIDITPSQLPPTVAYLQKNILDLTTNDLLFFENVTVPE